MLYLPFSCSLFSTFSFRLCHHRTAVRPLATRGQPRNADRFKLHSSQDEEEFAALNPLDNIKKNSEEREKEKDEGDRKEMTRTRRPADSCKAYYMLFMEQ
jgi:hypothetical protein